MQMLITRLASIILIINLTACLGTPNLRSILGDSWQEEAMQYDGSIIIVKRSNSYKGFHEIGQPIPIGEHRVGFTVPQTGLSYTWLSDYSEKFGRTNFVLLAVHVLGGTPYVVVEPNLCLAYNAWGRPNPPYLIFKNVDNVWKRIELNELPKQFTTLNVAVHPTSEFIHSPSPISARAINVYNSGINYPEYQRLMREPVSSKGFGLPSCPDWSDKRYTSPKAPTQ